MRASLCRRRQRHPVNPLGIRRKAESGVIYRLTAAIKGPITIKNDGVEHSDLRDYDMLRMHEAPDIQVHIVISHEIQPLPIGQTLANFARCVNAHIPESVDGCESG
jgi:hypothetical protein